MLYLLQLVQALKYENFEEIKEGYKSSQSGKSSTPRNSSQGSEDKDAVSLPEKTK